jgi:hypothetical protein
MGRANGDAGRDCCFPLEHSVAELAGLRLSGTDGRKAGACDGSARAMRGDRVGEKARVRCGASGASTASEIPALEESLFMSHDASSDDCETEDGPATAFAADERRGRERCRAVEQPDGPAAAGSPRSRWCILGFGTVCGRFLVPWNGAYAGKSWWTRGLVKPTFSGFDGLTEGLWPEYPGGI